MKSNESGSENQVVKSDESGDVRGRCDTVKQRHDLTSDSEEGVPEREISKAVAM